MAIAVFAMSCSSGELTRSKAERLINAHASANSSKERPLGIGIPFEVKDETLRKGADAGLWRPVKVTKPGPFVTLVFDAWELTAEGKRVLGSISDSNATFLPGVARQVAEITGISSPPELGGTSTDLKVADFTWRWSHGSLPPQVRFLPGLDVEGHGHALFKHYDDGWRVEELDWGTDSWQRSQ